jgi:hypothetical protein
VLPHRSETCRASDRCGRSSPTRTPFFGSEPAGRPPAPIANKKSPTLGTIHRLKHRWRHHLSRHRLHHWRRHNYAMGTPVLRHPAPSRCYRAGYGPATWRFLVPLDDHTGTRAMARLPQWRYQNNTSVGSTHALKHRWPHHPRHHRRHHDYTVENTVEYTIGDTMGIPCEHRIYTTQHH